MDARPMGIDPIKPPADGPPPGPFDDLKQAVLDIGFELTATITGASRAEDGVHYQVTFGGGGEIVVPYDEGEAAVIAKGKRPVLKAREDVQASIKQGVTDGTATLRPRIAAEALGR